MLLDYRYRQVRMPCEWQLSVSCKIVYNLTSNHFIFLGECLYCVDPVLYQAIDGVAHSHLGYRPGLKAWFRSAYFTFVLILTT